MVHPLGCKICILKKKRNEGDEEGRRRRMEKMKKHRGTKTNEKNIY